jgi:hypothetical protein
MQKKGLAITTSFSPHALSVSQLPMCVPVFETFVQHHKAHHYHLGSPTHDVDVPTHAEAVFVGNSSLRKMIWVLLHFALLPLRSMYVMVVVVVVVSVVVVVMTSLTRY